MGIVHSKVFTHAALGLRKQSFAAVIGVAALLLGHGANALNISKPTANQRFAAGPDYATDVLGDAWDFSNPEDIGQDPDETQGFANFTVNSAAHPGLAGGTTTNADAQVSLLYSGRYGIINPGRSGRKFPIDTNRYKKLSYKMSSTAAGDIPQLYWFHTAWNEPGSVGRNSGSQFLFQAVTGFKTYALDLTAGNMGIAWTNGVVRGLRFDPNSANFGHDVFLDWVRLTAADNAPGSAMQTVQWLSDTGAPVPATIEIIDGGGLGSVLTVAIGATSPHVWNYGVLPPGAYTLRVTSGPGAAATSTTTFVVNNPPSIRVTYPNETGGDDVDFDFATKVVGNSWDMSSIADIALTGAEGIENLNFNNPAGSLNATNVLNNNDPQIYLNTKSNPIDTNRYRYLTYTMQVDGAFNLGSGSIARVFWDSSLAGFNGTTATRTRDIVVFPGMNAYTIDLGSLTFAPDGGLETIVPPDVGGMDLWTSGVKRHLRLDPHEFLEQRSFHIDNVKLAAMAETSNNQFTLRFAGIDTDTQDVPLVSLYYDTDTDPTNGKTLIAPKPGDPVIKLSDGQFVWNTTGVPAGVYWIYAEVTDGLDTRGRYSTGPIRVIGPPVASGPLDVDASSTATKYDPLTDGILVIRYMFGLTGSPLTNGALGGTATRTDPGDIKRHLDSIRASLDIDDNKLVEPLADGLLVIRYLFGLRGNPLIQGAIGAGAMRTSSAAIEAQIQSLMP